MEQRRTRLEKNYPNLTKYKMSKSIKLKDNTYIDSSGVVYGTTKLNEKIQSLTSDISTLNNKSRYGYYGEMKSYSSVSDFKSDIITSNYMAGCYFVTLNFNGSISCALVQKANNSYLSFIHFSYGIIAKQYRYLNGTWYETSL